MALSQEVIEAEANPSVPPKAAGFSSRPLWIGIGVVALLLVIALSVSLSDSKSTKAKKDEEKTQLVPNRRTAAELQQAASDSAGQGLQVPAQAVPPAAPQGYTATAPGAGMPGGPSLAAYKAAAETQLMAHALEVQKWQLELHKDALSASSSAPAFAELKKQQAAKARHAVEGEGDDPTGALAALGSMGGMGEGGPAGLLQAAAPSLQMLNMARGMGVPGGGGGFGPAAFGMGGSPPNGTDPQMSQQKLNFFQRGGSQLVPGVLDSTVRQQVTPYELQMGAVIPGVMISGVHSEAPGQIIGQVSENVYDSATGQYLLIPQGSRVVGTYNATISKGQYRVQVAWVRLNFPNGASIDLGGMSGADQAGVSGFEDQINRHFLRRLAAALMTSAFTVGYEVTAPRNGNQTEGAVHRGLGESLVELGADMAREEGQLPPTLEIRSGYRFVIHVAKDMRFPSPYEDGINRDVRRR